VKNFILLITVLTHLITASTQAYEGENLDLVNELFIDTWDRAYDIAVNGDYAYIAAGESGIKVVDVSDYEKPDLVNSVDDIEGYSRRIRSLNDLVFLIYSEVGGDYPYRSDSTSNFLAIYSAENPSELELISEIQLHDGWVSQFIISERHVFTTITFSSDGESQGFLQEIDYTDLENPQITTLWSAEEFIRDVCFMDDFFLIVTGYNDNGNLLILDISDPDNISATPLFEEVELSGFAYALYRDNIIYLSYNYGSEFVCIDVSDIENPEILGSCNLPEWGCGGHVFDMEISNNFLYVAYNNSYCGGFNTPERDGDEDSFVAVIDISDPNSLEVIGYNDPPWVCDFGHYSRGIEISGDNVFVALGAGMKIMDYFDPEDVGTTGYFESGGSNWDLEINGDNLFLVRKFNDFSRWNAGGSVQVFDIEDVENIDTITYLGLRVNDIVIEGNLAFTAGDELAIWDISNIREINDIQSMEINSRNLRIEDTLLATISPEDDESSNLYIINISDPSDPEIISNYQLLSSYFSDLREMEFNDNFLYLMAKWELKILDISDPRNPREVFNYRASNLGDFVIRNDKMFLSSRLSSLTMFDISDPAEPDSIWTNRFGNYGGRQKCNLELSGDYLYLEGGSNSMVLLDISNPDTVEVVGRADFGEFEGIIDIQSDNNLVYVTFDQCVFILRNTLIDLEVEAEAVNPQEFALMGAYPNPFNSTTTIEYILPFASEVTLNLYNLSGRRIETLVNGRMQAGVHRVMLDARDMASGLYFMKLEGSGLSLTRKVMLIR